MLPLEYNLSKYKSKYLKSAGFHLSLLKIAVASFIRIPRVLGNFVSPNIFIFASNQIASLSNNFSIPAIFFLCF